MLCPSPERIAGVATASVSNNGVDFPPGTTIILLCMIDTLFTLLFIIID